MREVAELRWDGAREPIEAEVEVALARLVADLRQVAKLCWDGARQTARSVRLARPVPVSSTLAAQAEVVRQRGGQERQLGRNRPAERVDLEVEPLHPREPRHLGGDGPGDAVLPQLQVVGQRREMPQFGGDGAAQLVQAQVQVENTGERRELRRHRAADKPLVESEGDGGIVAGAGRREVGANAHRAPPAAGRLIDRSAKSEKKSCQGEPAALASSGRHDASAVALQAGTATPVPAGHVAATAGGRARPALRPW